MERVLFWWPAETSRRRLANRTPLLFLKLKQIKIFGKNDAMGETIRIEVITGQSLSENEQYSPYHL